MLQELTSGARFLADQSKKTFAFATKLGSRYFQSLNAKWISHPSGPIKSSDLVMKRTDRKFQPDEQAVIEIDTFVVNKITGNRADYTKNFDPWAQKIADALRDTTEFSELKGAIGRSIVKLEPIEGIEVNKSDVSPKEAKELLIASGESYNQKIRTARNQIERQISDLLQTDPENKTLQTLNDLFTNQMPQLALFTDGRMPLVRTSDIITTDKGFEVSHGEVSYSQYVGTRESDSSKVSEDLIGIQFATLALTFVIDEKGQKNIMYTLRASLNEAFPDTLNFIGGAGQLPKDDSPYNPVEHIRKELGQEAGIPQSKLITPENNCIGIVRETYFNYMQPVYEFHIHGMEHFTPYTVSGEQFYHFANKRSGAKEVDLKIIPWNEQSILNLVSAIPMKEGLGDPNPRLWVPAGMMALLQAGKLDFGDKWFDTALKAHENSLKELAKIIGK